MTLADELWQHMRPWYAAVLVHPFLTELADGTLDPEAFARYLGQDALYLAEYARALAAVAARATNAAATEMFARHAAGALAVERKLHETLLPQLGVDIESVTEMSLTTAAYTSYLLAVTNTGSYAEGVAAVLPCYWIYWEVGKELLRRGSPDARYQRWIEAYGGDEFGAVVDEVLREVNRLEESSRAALAEHVRVTSRYEWMFWDSAYRRETWPSIDR